MSDTRRYRFATAAQWRAGQLARATMLGDGMFAPVAPWGPAIRLAGAGRAAAVASNATAWWNDGTSLLWQAESDVVEAMSRPAPAPLVRATHLVAGRIQLWACDARPLLWAYPLDASALRLKVELADHGIEGIVDIAADGADGVWVLARRDDHALALNVDCAGQTGRCVELPMPCGMPRGLTWAAGRLVLLDATGTLLSWIDPLAPGSVMDVRLNSVRPGAAAGVISSDATARIVVAGVDAVAFGGSGWVASATADGEWLDTIDFAEPPIDVACSAASLIVTTASAVWRSAVDASGSGRRRESSARFITPVLESPPAEGRAPWLRAEVSAWLPEGCSLELACASTDDADQLTSVRDLLAQTDLAPALRRQRLDGQLAWSAPLHFERDPGSGDGRPTLCALPLHDLRTHWLWMSVTLIAAPGAASPRVESLEVLYPDESLMQHLPAIYRRQAEQQPGDFVLTIVAALETSVASLDQRIATLGQLVDPRDAPEAWLDAMARWLGLPWDDALPADIKRRLLAAAPAVLRQRGTRAGLQALLAALLPPGRARIVDIGVEHGFALLAGTAHRGARLPALLSGWRCDSMVLNRKACIGIGRLPSPADPPDSVDWLAGLVEVEVRAAPAERKQWLEWLPALIDAMTPLTAQLRLQWSTDALPAPVRLGDALTLGDALDLAAEPDLRLGAGAALGQTRLAALGTGAPGITLTGAGPEPGFRLH